MANVVSVVRSAVAAWHAANVDVLTHLIGLAPDQLQLVVKVNLHWPVPRLETSYDRKRNEKCVHVYETPLQECGKATTTFVRTWVAHPTLSDRHQQNAPELFRLVPTIQTCTAREIVYEDDNVEVFWERPYKGVPIAVPSCTTSYTRHQLWGNSTLHYERFGDGVKWHANGKIENLTYKDIAVIAFPLSEFKGEDMGELMDARLASLEETLQNMYDVGETSARSKKRRCME